MVKTEVFKNIIIFGGSAGAEISQEIFLQSYMNCNIFFSDTYKTIHNEDRILNYEEAIYKIINEGFDYFIATGDNFMRAKHHKTIKEKTNKEPLNCIHKSAVVSPSSIIGYGNLICPLSLLHTNSIIGNCTIINSGSIIEHDCMVNDYSQISPNTTLCGRVKISEYSFIGASSVVLPNLHISKYSVVGAGSVVTDYVTENVMVAGVPAKIKKTNYYEI